MNAFILVGECAEKSELVRRLVVELVGRGLWISTIKRVSDAVDLEKPGSGTWKHRAAGAAEVMIASASRFALLSEMPQTPRSPRSAICWRAWRPWISSCWMASGGAATPRWKSCRPDRTRPCWPRVTPWR
jgi:hypothetical protein